MRKQTKYVSEIDALLAELRESLPESESRKAEKEKYIEINRKRDHVSKPTDSEIWEKF